MDRLIKQLEIEPGKAPGFLAILLGLVTGFIAQGTFPPVSGGEAQFWNFPIWWESLGSNSSPLLGLLLYALAGFFFIFGLNKLGVQGHPSRFSVNLDGTSHEPRFGFWLTSLALSALTAYFASQPGLANQNGFGLTVLWLFSIFLFSISVLLYTGPQFAFLRKVTEWLAANRKEIFFLGLLLFGAFLLRFWDLELHPYSFVNDEGEIGKVGSCILSGKCNNLFAITWAAQPTMAFTADALSISIFGKTAFAIRMVSALTGTLAVLFVYLFTRETFGEKTAWVAAIILSSLPVHVHFSRIGVDNIIDSLSSAVLIWLVFHATRKGSLGWYLAAGIVAGVCMYTYPGTRLSLLLGLGALGLIVLRTPGYLRTQWRNLAIFGLAALVTVGPIGAVFFTDPNGFFARFNGVGVIQTGTLQSQMNNAGSSSAMFVLTQQFLKSSLVFIATPAPGQFFNSPRPYFSFVGAVFLVFGLFALARRVSDTRYAIISAWFFGAIIFGSTLTSAPPSSQRMLSSSSASAVVAAIGLVAIIEALQHSGSFFRRAAPVLLIAMLLFNSYQDISYYFVNYRANHYFEDLSNEITYESRVLISPLGKDGALYLIAMPMTNVSFGNFDYFSPEVAKVNFENVTRESLAALPKDKDALFIAAPFREKDILNIKTWIPNGQWTAQNRRYQPDQPLFFAYKVTKAQLQAFQP